MYIKRIDIVWVKVFRGGKFLEIGEDMKGMRVDSGAVRRRRVE